MRFIGGKKRLLEEIYNIIKININEPIKVIGDLFSGSAVVSDFFKEKGFKVISNDIMYMSYILSRGSLELNGTPKFNNLEIGTLDEVINFLNSLEKPLNEEEAFIYKNYSPNNDCKRMYFQTKNAIKIDAVRQQIEKWFKSNKITEEEYFYLLACLISSVPYISNITGVYAAYLKHWDKRTYNDLKLAALPIIKSKEVCEFYNMDAIELCKKREFDLVYIDPPYNSREYTANYHVLETIARYDNPEIHGKTGMRNYKKSEFCSKTKVEGAFIELFSSLKTKYAIVSYNNEALLSTEKMMDIFKNFGKVELYEFPYRRYKSKIPNNENGLKEQIYFVDLR